MHVRELVAVEGDDFDGITVEVVGLLLVKSLVDPGVG